MRCRGGQGGFFSLEKMWGLVLCKLVFLREYFLGGVAQEALTSALSPQQYNVIKKWLEVDVAPDIRGRIPLLLTSLSFKVSAW